MSFQSDKVWSDRYLPLAEEVLRKHLGAIAAVRVALDEEDCGQATDFMVESSAGAVAVRFRRPRHHPAGDFRDLTLRSRRLSGVPTELAKIRDGHARWYLYGWLRDDGTLEDYIIVDLDRVRARGLLDRPFHERSNQDGRTWFIVITVAFLRAEGCLTVDQCRSSSPPPRGDFHPPSPDPALPAPPVRKKDDTPTQKDLFRDWRGGP
jgi:hypothetical protein